MTAENTLFVRVISHCVLAAIFFFAHTQSMIFSVNARIRMFERGDIGPCFSEFSDENPANFLQRNLLDTNEE